MNIEPLPVNLDGEFPETLDEYGEGFYFLAEYATKKAQAMRLRADGDNRCFEIERELDDLYGRLPPWKGW